jgi:hypothetical protein
MKKVCLIIEWIKLPQNLKDLIKKRYEHFYRDIYLKHRSEFCARTDYIQGMKCIEDYYTDQTSSDMEDKYRFKGTIEEFIVSYGLEFDVWIIEQNFDFVGVEEILIHVSW